MRDNLDSLNYESSENQEVDQSQLCDPCNSIAWIAAAACLIVAFFLLSPNWIEAEKLTATQKESLTLNEKGVAAATKREYPRAESLTREALKVDPGNVSAAVNLASILLAQEKSKEAISLLEQYKDRSQNDVDLVSRLGDAYFSDRQTEKALEAYKLAAKLDPKLPGVHSKLATIYSLKNNLQESEQHLQKAIELEPNSEALYGNLASIKLATGKVDEAIAHAKRAIQIKPSSEVYVTLGTAYEMKKDFKSSLIAFERAQDLGDERDELDEKISEIKAQI